ncbi:MAG: ATP-binding protein [Gemmatimonadales bacterium]
MNPSAALVFIGAAIVLWLRATSGHRAAAVRSADLLSVLILLVGLLKVLQLVGVPVLPVDQLIQLAEDPLRPLGGPTAMALGTALGLLFGGLGLFLLDKPRLRGTSSLIGAALTAGVLVFSIGELLGSAGGLALSASAPIARSTAAALLLLGLALTLARPDEGIVGAFRRNELSIRRTLFFSFGLTALVLGVVVATTGYSSVAGWRATETRRAGSTARRELSGLLVSLLSMESGQRGFLLSGDTLFLDPYRTGAASVDQHLAVLATIGWGSAAADPLTPLLRGLVGRKVALMADLVERRRTGGTAKFLPQFMTGHGKAVMDSIRVVVTALDDIEIMRTDQADEQLRVAMRRALGFGGGAALLMVLFLAFTSTAISRGLAATEAARDHIEELNVKLEGKMQDVETQSVEMAAFSYSVSHDLRAPLRAIDGFSRLLVNEHAAQLSPEAHRLLGVIRDRAQRMARLIDELLMLAQVTRREPKFERVDQDALVREVVGELRETPAGQRVEFDVGRLPESTGDVGLLRQVWSNLLGNAVKYSARVETPRVAVSGATEPSGELVYRIVDNGVGFDMAHVDKLFGVFQRLHAPSEFEGTGVGLATVQRVIRRHGGRVWATGSPGRGAEFCFTLPARE